MEGFATPVPGSAIDLAWLIPLVPAVSAGLLMLFGKRLGRLSGAVAITAVGFSAVMATVIFATLQGQPAEERVFVTTLAQFLPAGGQAGLTVDWALLIDPLATIMMLLVGWVGLFIHVYSLGYMAGDDRYPRFFAYLNLFVASMLVLVTGSSFLTLFIGWELVGLCSYLLIGFWFETRTNASAAQKAFVVNRVGDVGFMVAMFAVFAIFGTLSFAEVLPEAGSALSTGSAVAIGLLLLLAAAGKSAQIPLYVWLPDAMAGPTPVSALIHAATMVTAGVYLIARVSPIYAVVPGVGLVVAWVGVLTALVAALIACAQRDYKRILAYSTISQLGYMFVGVGLGAQIAGVFHLLTHGFFKALLFLVAGSVMHAMAEDTDVWNMGGLRKAMPVTFVTAVIAWAAIVGIPPLSGFFSKEEILVAALDTPGAEAIWVIGVLVAGLTAFYMSRWLFLIFFTRPRYGDDAHPHESPLSMTLSLAVLAVAAAFGGLLNLTPESGFLHGWLETSVASYVGEQAFLPETLALVLTLLVSAAGIAWAAALYLRPSLSVETIRQRARERAARPGLYRAAYELFYLDTAYDRGIAEPGRWLSKGFAAFDGRVVDGAVNGIARATTGLAGVGRRVQSGLVRNYALAVLTGAVLVTAALLGTLFFGGLG
jgi:NADH-quinone oxidoreductase subunit L